MIIEALDKSKNLMQNVKQRFFAMRNGMIADTLRQAGCSYKVIFGLNLPQLREIAAVFAPDEALANDLWANSATRESRLLAPMLVEPSLFTKDKALAWIDTLMGNIEEIDVLCHSLLRKTAYKNDLVEMFRDSENDLRRYLALRLAFSQVNAEPDKIRRLAIKEIARDCKLTQNVSVQLKNEAEFLLESLE